MISSLMYRIKIMGPINGHCGTPLLKRTGSDFFLSTSRILWSALSKTFAKLASEFSNNKVDFVTTIETVKDAINQLG